jgi:hypothetical protein
MHSLLRIVSLAGLAGVLVLGGCSVSVGGRASGPVAKAPPPLPVPPPQAPAHGERRNFTYVYYPDVEVYYSHERGMWFWLEGDTWKFGVVLPRHYVVRLGTSVSIDLDCERPYERHEMVCAKYPGRNGRGHAYGHVKGKGHADADGDRDRDRDRDRD